MQEFCMPDVCMEIVEHARISSLPDEVLTHILSFLSTKEAVYTCVLSKTWRKIWSTVPILNFNSCEFLMDDQDGDEGRRSEARFERFVRDVLDNRESTNLDIVHYSHQLHWSEAIVSMEWLDHVARLMPREIHIDIDGNFYEVDVPDLIFSCASLQHLSMSLDTVQLSNNIIRPVSINLPSLKFLELYWVELPDDFAEKLVNGCPSLEKLILCGCESKFSSISSEVLKELNWDGCYPYEQMQISCPNLVSLILRINLKSGGISLKNMSSLVNVDIRLYGYHVDYVQNLNLFCGISNATNLELHLNLPPKFKEQLEKDIPNCGNFNNLKKLIVVGKWNMSYDFYMIACLLKHSPNLKELHLLFNESRDQIQEHREDDSRDVLYEYLETVKIGNEYGRKLSSKQINAMIKTLGSYVKKIGNLIMT